MQHDRNKIERPWLVVTVATSMPMKRGRYNRQTGRPYRRQLSTGAPVWRGSQAQVKDIWNSWHRARRLGIMLCRRQGHRGVWPLVDIGRQCRRISVRPTGL